MITITLKNAEAKLVRRLLKAHSNVTTKYVRAYELTEMQKRRYEHEGIVALSVLAQFDEDAS